MIEWNKKKWSLLLYILIGIIVAFLIIPICVNVLLGSKFNPTPFELNGTTSGWHNFWAVYLGALIGAIVPLIILYITIQNNNDENEHNRSLQIKTIKYQTKIAWINQLRDAIGYSQELLSFAIQDKYRLSKNQGESSTNQLSTELFDNANKVNRRFISVLWGTGEIEQKFLNFTANFCERYLCYIFDLEFLYNLADSITQDELKHKVAVYKTRRNSSTYSEKRIWHIIEERAYSTDVQDRTYYINEISKRYEFETFESKCLELLQYELTQANRIFNDTEQNK